MKIYIILTIVFLTSISYGQTSEKVSTIDFVQILNGNKEEAIFFYQHNWKVLREMAVDKQYIDSFQILETPANDEATFNLMLITTYANQEQYARREEHFADLIKEKGALKLLNEKKPNDFRKTLFTKEMVRPIN